MSATPSSPPPPLSLRVASHPLYNEALQRVLLDLDDKHVSGIWDVGCGREYLLQNPGLRKDSILTFMSLFDPQPALICSSSPAEACLPRNSSVWTLNPAYVCSLVR